MFVLRQTRVRAALGNALWRVPAIGERLKVYQLARFYRTIGMLLQRRHAAGHARSAWRPSCCTRCCASGSPPASRAISEGRAVSHVARRQRPRHAGGAAHAAVGERSGNMGEMMERIAGFHDEELARWVDWFTRLFEPLLMAVIGLVIGAIVVLMYMPIFELAGNLQ